MAIKRIITEEQKSKIKDLAKYKGRSIKDLTKEEKDDLLELIAKKLNIL